MDAPHVVEREGRETDRAFIFATWLKSLWTGQHRQGVALRDQPLMRLSLGEMRRDDFMALQHDRIERLLATSRVTVLHPAGAPDVIAAWAVTGKALGIVHYVYVRDIGGYRGHGFARRLLVGNSTCTHLTLPGLRLKEFLGLRYMPHLLDGAA